MVFLSVEKTLGGALAEFQFGAYSRRSVKGQGRRKNMCKFYTLAIEERSESLTWPSSPRVSPRGTRRQVESRRSPSFKHYAVRSLAVSCLAVAKGLADQVGNDVQLPDQQTLET